MQYQRDFTIGVKELRDFYMSLQMYKWKSGLVGFGAVSVLTAWMYLGMLVPGLSGAGKVAAAVALGLVAAAAVAAGMMASARHKVNLQMRASGRTTYVQVTELNGFGVHVSVDKSKTKLPFEKIHKVHETQKAFYIYVSGTQAWILPKAQMDGPEEEKRLRELLSMVIESRRLQLKKG